MFEYSCNDIKLVNWIFQQVNGGSELLFPREKGWRLYLNLYYATSAGHAVFLVTLVNDEEFLTFLIVDKLVEENVIKQFRQSKIIKYIQESLNLRAKRSQLIFLVSEKYGKSVIKCLRNDLRECSVLILNADSIGFAQGGFQNSRVEFRLSQLTFDADLISDSIPPGLWHFEEGLAKASTFQYLFHSLSRYWMRGEKKIKINYLLAETIPYWENYSKKNRKELLSFIYNEFDNLIALFFKDIFKIQSGKDGTVNKNSSVLETTLDPQIRKNHVLWIKKQNEALEWLKNNTEQISLD